MSRRCEPVECWNLLERPYYSGITPLIKEVTGRMLEQRLTEWMDKVLAAHESDGMTDTLQMIVDIDRIIADEFDRDPVLEENQCRQDMELSM